MPESSIKDLLQHKALLQIKPLDEPGAIIFRLTAEGKPKNSIVCFARKVFIFVARRERGRLCRIARLRSLILQEVL